MTVENMHDIHFCHSEGAQRPKNLPMENVGVA